MKRGSVAKREVMRLSPWALGNALGTTSALVLFGAAFMSWVSGYYDADLLAAQYPLSFSVNDWTFIVGLIQTYVYSYVGGLFVATFYNRALQ